MAFHERNYDVYILKGTKETTDLWDWQHWQTWALALAPFTQSERGNATVRCNQFTGFPAKAITYGKLAWNEKSHIKWAHHSPVNVGESKDWEFLSVEAWTPGWTACVRENLAPDFYFSMSNTNCYNRKDRKESPFIVCAIPVTSDEGPANKLKEVLLSLTTSLPFSLFAYKRRPWGISSSPRSSSFTYGIQDMRDDVLSGEGNFHAKPFNEDILPETWEIIKV